MVELPPAAPFNMGWGSGTWRPDESFRLCYLSTSMAHLPAADVVCEAFRRGAAAALDRKQLRRSLAERSQTSAAPDDPRPESAAIRVYHGGRRCCQLFMATVGAQPPSFVQNLSILESLSDDCGELETSGWP